MWWGGAGCVFRPAPVTSCRKRSVCGRPSPRLELRRLKMRLSLAVLLLGAKGGLAQGREPSEWDDLVAGWTCTSDSTKTYTCDGMTCRSNNSFVAASQTDAKIGTVELKPAGFEVKAFYVTDQYGTIIAYDNASTGNTMTFTIPESTTAVVPHFLVDGTCEDLFTLVPTWVSCAPLPARAGRVRLPPRPTPACLIPDARLRL